MVRKSFAVVRNYVSDFIIQRNIVILGGKLVEIFRHVSFKMTEDDGLDTDGAEIGHGEVGGRD